MTAIVSTGAADVISAGNGLGLENVTTVHSKWGSASLVALLALLAGCSEHPAWLRQMAMTIDHRDDPPRVVCSATFIERSNPPYGTVYSDLSSDQSLSANKVPLTPDQNLYTAILPADSQQVHLHWKDDSKNESLQQDLPMLAGLKRVWLTGSASNPTVHWEPAALPNVHVYWVKIDAGDTVANKDHEDSPGQCELHPDKPFHTGSVSVELGREQHYQAFGTPGTIDVRDFRVEKLSL